MKTGMLSLERNANVIQVRSASRLGESDFNTVQLACLSLEYPPNPPINWLALFLIYPLFKGRRRRGDLYPNRIESDLGVNRQRIETIRAKLK
ncbi:DUF1499 domain-containing protein [Nostoc sp.]|uniref:DUF1499 domain-containing protein n=1 Tax=Nostoc sp. TaxID=1180 RepID=UPI003FA5A146